jgi:hypothetical protein
MTFVNNSKQNFAFYKMVCLPYYIYLHIKKLKFASVFDTWTKFVLLKRKVQMLSAVL